MDCFSTSTIYESSPNPYCLLFQGISLIPLWHYLIASLIFILLFLYNFIEFHFFEDLLTGFRGSPVLLTFNPRSHIYDAVVSKCSILHARYLATPWLSSPHVQTVFLGFFGRPPVFSYRREIFQCSDGGTIALDWLSNSDALKDAFLMNSFISKDDTTPIVVVVPGLTSDSASAYLKHFAFHMAKSGWHVVISNHRGLGGVSITSDCFYNAGWTEDVRAVVRHLHSEYPKAPLFVVGTSIGANVLVKYLGEDGDDVPIAGAVAICSPWDLLVSLRRKALPRVKQPIGDRFISRRLVQKFYDRALAIGLQGYAQLHQPLFSRLANWEGIEKSRSIRDFDNHATRLVGKYETVDTYYRRCSSASYVGNVSIPLLCISALDDPVCTREAIPWDECRANKNIVLATTKHGGHLAFFEGISASSLWWVRAVIEYLKVLHSSEYMHVQKKVVSCGPQSSLDSSIDQGPFVNVTNGMVVAMSTDQTRDDNIEETSDAEKTCEGRGPDADQNVQRPKQESDNCLASNTAEISRHITSVEDCKPFEATLPVRRCLDLLRQQNRFSMWLLAYVALVTSWPLLGSIFQYFRKKRKNLLLPGLIGR